MEIVRLYMPDYGISNLVTLTKTNIIDEMPFGDGTLRTAGVGNMAASLRKSLRRGLSYASCLLQTWAEAPAAQHVPRRPGQRYRQLQHLTIVILKFHCILNASPSLQVVSRACGNALVVFQSNFPSSRWG